MDRRPQEERGRSTPVAVLVPKGGPESSLQVEIHELELRYAALRIGDSGRQARLEASLARDGQQSPVLVIAGGHDESVLVDG